MVGCEQKPQKLTLIRIANRSNQDFDSVIVNFSKETVDFGQLPKGETTMYRQIGLAYRSAYIEVVIGDKKFFVRPVDHVTEPPLGGGRFTYELTFHPERTDYYTPLGFKFTKDWVPLRNGKRK